MEQFIKFAFYGLLFIIYVVSQIRKMRKKAEEERALQPEPAKPLVTKQVATNSKKEFDYKGKREMKPHERKSVFNPKIPNEDKPIVYKPVADEELIAQALLENRKKEAKALKTERKPLSDEHLEPYMEQHANDKMNLDWLKDKNNLKKAFIAAEVFQRRY